MAKSDLLKEAIADAKAVKETALANAKIALEEAFAPRIHGMLSAKLSEELDDEDMEAPTPEPTMEHDVMYEPEGEEGMGAEMDMEAPAPEMDTEIDMEAPAPDMEAPADEEIVVKKKTPLEETRLSNIKWWTRNLITVLRATILEFG